MPVKGTVKTAVPLLEREKLPESAPEVVGLKTMVAVTLCPAPRVNGVVNPVLNPTPVTESCVMLADALPVFVILTVCDVVVLRAALPNARLAGVAVSVALLPPTGVGEGVGVGEADPPAAALSVPLPPQPIIIMAASASPSRESEKFSVVVCCFKGVTPALLNANFVYIGFSANGPKGFFCSASLLQHFVHSVSTVN